MKNNTKIYNRFKGFTQEENGQSRKIGAEKASNIKTFQLPHFEG